MKNWTLNSDILLIEGLKVNRRSSFPAFFFLLLIYIFIMMSNLGLTALILLERSLREPMYLLFCNMSINDVFGASAIIPRLISDIFVPTSERLMLYNHCVIQAFCANYNASVSHTVLMIMAFDRYVAICSPLRYSAIMTNRMMVYLSVGAWGSVFVLVVILIGLSVRLSRCRWIVENPFCDNATLFKLSCESILINNIYGLAYTVVLLGSSIGSVTLTYLKVTTVCLQSKNKVLNSRALQTCSTHLVLYLLLLLSGSINIILHRFQNFSDYRKLVHVLLHVVPPALNPVIYGLQIKVVQEKLLILFTRNPRL